MLTTANPASSLVSSFASLASFASFERPESVVQGCVQQSTDCGTLIPNDLNCNLQFLFQGIYIYIYNCQFCFTIQMSLQTSLDQLVIWFFPRAPTFRSSFRRFNSRCALICSMVPSENFARGFPPSSDSTETNLLGNHWSLVDSDWWFNKHQPSTIFKILKDKLSLLRLVLENLRNLGVPARCCPSDDADVNLNADGPAMANSQGADAPNQTRTL